MICTMRVVFVYLEQSYIRKGKRTQVYYAHPYCSGERGTNENNNDNYLIIDKEGNILNEDTINLDEILNNTDNRKEATVGTEEKNNGDFMGEPLSRESNSEPPSTTKRTVSLESDETQSALLTGVIKKRSIWKTCIKQRIYSSKIYI